MSVLGAPVPVYNLFVVAASVVIALGITWLLDGLEVMLSGSLVGILKDPRAMGFSEGMAAGDQGQGLLVVHGHAPKGFANIFSGGERIGITVRTFRIYVDEAHLQVLPAAIEDGFECFAGLPHEELAVAPGVVGGGAHCAEVVFTLFAANRGADELLIE